MFIRGHSLAQSGTVSTVYIDYQPTTLIHKLNPTAVVVQHRFNDGITIFATVVVLRATQNHYYKEQREAEAPPLNGRYFALSLSRISLNYLNYTTRNNINNTGEGAKGPCSTDRINYRFFVLVNKNMNYSCVNIHITLFQSVQCNLCIQWHSLFHISLPIKSSFIMMCYSANIYLLTMEQCQIIDIMDYSGHNKLTTEYFNSCV